MIATQHACAVCALFHFAGSGLSLCQRVKINMQTFFCHVFLIKLVIGV